MKLKPCPLCGRNVRVVGEPDMDGEIVWSIEHIDKEPICFTQALRYADKHDDVVELWNRRAGEPDA